VIHLSRESEGQRHWRVPPAFPSSNAAPLFLGLFTCWLTSQTHSTSSPSSTQQDALDLSKPCRQSCGSSITGIAVGGPGVGYSSTWSAWHEADSSFYILARDLRSTTKISLHPTRNPTTIAG
jgi:hypothetical protein